MLELLWVCVVTPSAPQWSTLGACVPAQAELVATGPLVYPKVPHLEGDTAKGVCTRSAQLLGIILTPPLRAWGHSLVGKVLAWHAEILSLVLALYTLGMVVYTLRRWRQED